MPREKKASEEGKKDVEQIPSFGGERKERQKKKKEAITMARRPLCAARKRDCLLGWRKLLAPVAVTD